jgi:hypothetical protein
LWYLCFSFILQSKQFPIQEAKAELRKIVAFTGEHTAFVNHKKKEIVDFHLHNNPFTKKGYNRKLKLGGFTRFDKSDLQNHC